MKAAAFLLFLALAAGFAGGGLGQQSQLSQVPIDYGPGEVLVDTSAALASALANNTIRTVLIGHNTSPPTSARIALSNPFGTVKIPNNTTVTSVDPKDPSTLDLNRQLEAIQVLGPANFTLKNVIVINQTSRYEPNISQIAVGAPALNLWPSVTVDNNSSFSILNITSTSLNGSCNNWAPTILNPLNVFLGQANTLQQGYAELVNSTTILLPSSVFFPKLPLLNLSSNATVGTWALAGYSITLVCETDYLNPDGTPVEPPSQPKKKQPAWVWVLVALAIGFVVGVVIVGGIVFWRRRRKRRSQPEQVLARASTQQDSFMVDEEMGGKLQGMDSGSGGAAAGPAGADLTAEVKLGPLIGRGAFGKVYKARWKGAIVAVKIVEHRPNLEDVADARVARETLLSSSVLHPNVVATYKIATFNSRHRSNSSNNELDADKPATVAEGEAVESQVEEPLGEEGPQTRDETAAEAAEAAEAGAVDVDMSSAPAVVQQAVRRVQDSAEAGLFGPDPHNLDEDMYETWMVLEFCDRGSLEKAIDAGRFRRKGNEGDAVKMVNVFRCLLDIASGMQYLHSLGILHGDLKAANVLLKSSGAADSRGFTCKLADFGLSRMIEAVQTHVTTTSYGTISHMPAELISKGKLTRAVDVYSFGMIMWELITSKCAFAGMSTVHVIYLVVNQGYRPPVPDDTPGAYRALMERCWAADADERPTFTDIEKVLQRLHLEARAAVPSDKKRRSESTNRSASGSTAVSGGGDDSQAGTIPPSDTADEEEVLPASPQEGPESPGLTHPQGGGGGTA